MRDRTLIIIASLVAAAGLVILFMQAPPETTGFVLEGTVVDVHGSTILVATNVTVVARGQRMGESFRSTVFWADNRFVALRPT